MSVSAEADRSAEAYHKIVIPKTEEAKARIHTAAAKSFLFHGLESGQMQELVDAMREMETEAGQTVITEGENGDYFYVIDSGKFDVLKLKDGEQTKVWAYDHEGSFGELALMYNCPRSATVTALTDGVVWALDRGSFRHIIVEATRKKRQMFEGFLEKVAVFANLSREERSKIADCLEGKTYEDGDTIIKQGDVGNNFFVIEEGTCVALMTPKGESQPVQVGQMETGQYFGERALIKDAPRACDVVAKGRCKVAAMERSAFDRLLGNLQDIMSRHIEEYKTAEQVKKENGNA